MITSPAFSGQTYAILGLARSGAATARALLASGAQVSVWDRREEARTPFAQTCQIADPLNLDLTGYDAVVVSPGVPLNTHPIVAHAAQFGVPVIGDIEVFARARADLPRHKVVGVTGTNGKSTTVSLIQHILTHAGRASVLGGNIGEPILAQDPPAPGTSGEHAGEHAGGDMGADVGVYVLELSSYQIDLTTSLDCDIAGLTNLTPDHLDRYDGFAAYGAAKERLFAMQSPAHSALFASDEGAAGAMLARVQAERRQAGQQQTGQEQVEHGQVEQGRAHYVDAEPYRALQPHWPGLQGPHNLANAALAIAIVEQLGVSAAQWRAALPHFRALAHRMETVEVGDAIGDAIGDAGVTFVNDSKATNTDASAPALAAFPPHAIAPDQPRIHWIVGGLAKDDGLGACAAHLGNVAAAYTIGEAGPRFAQWLDQAGVPVEPCELLSEATTRAYAHARPGDVVLFSPACASFDQFRDYEQRGEHFRQLAKAVTGGEKGAVTDALTRGADAPAQWKDDAA